MLDPSRATDANDPSVPNNIQLYLRSAADRTLQSESSGLWNGAYDNSATASDVTALDYYDLQVYHNDASLLAPLPDLATDYTVNHYPGFSDRTEISGYGVMSGEAMVSYSPYYYVAEPSSSLLPTRDSRPAARREYEDVSTGIFYPASDRPPPPPQLESNDCHPKQTDVPKARIIRKKNRQPRPPAGNKEYQLPPSPPCPPVELGELGLVTQRADPRTSRALLKRRLELTPPPEVDRADKRRRRNTTQDVTRIRPDSGRKELPDGVAAYNSLGHESPGEEEALVVPRRSHRLSKQQNWEQASFREDDDSSTSSPGPGEPGPSTRVQNTDMPSPRSVDSDYSWDRPARRSKSKTYRCRRCWGSTKFVRKNDLIRHCNYSCKAKVSDDHDKSRLQCNHCHKILSRPDALRRHQESPGACGGKIGKAVKKAERSKEEEDEAWGE